jgi:hypothetical protein
MLEACSRERKAGGVHSSKLISFPRPTGSVCIHSLFIFLRCVLALRSHICRRRPRHEFIESPPRQHERPHGAVGQQPQSHKTLAITTGGRFRNCPHFYLCSIPLPPAALRWLALPAARHPPQFSCTRATPSRRYVKPFSVVNAQGFNLTLGKR